ncbi:MAG: excinuclease ABC subunit UvrC [Clostridia bacterium]|nr:excinuclease ABC subunit UvrC [Clostridia bacterium]
MPRDEKIRRELLSRANSLPLSPGVYIMKDRNGGVIYVGKSRKLKNRVSQYFQNGEKNIKTARMVAAAYDFEYFLCDTEIEALTLENTLIKKHNPKYNVRLKDAKSYPYIKITDEEYPRIIMTRKRESDKGRYFGPYSGTATVYAVIDTLRRALNLPTCNRRFPRDIGKERPCIYYQIKRCCGVCNGDVSAEEYSYLIGLAAEILKGNTTAVKQSLTQQMYEYSEAERYEAAAKCRDTLVALEKLSQKQNVVASPDSEQDVIGFFADELSSCVSVLYIRGGAVNDKEDILCGGDRILDAEGVGGFLIEHYKGRGAFPKTVLLSVDMDDEEVEGLSHLLSEMAGRKVNVRVPVRGANKTLCALAVSNAAEKVRQYKLEAEQDEGALVRLASLLGLEVYPSRIEAYDISNLGAEHITAGMVVLNNGKLARSDYRYFRIKSVEGTDDYAAMREALSRRLAHLSDGEGSFSACPDLILLDGGRGHVAVVRQLMSEMGLDIPVFGMVKDDFHKTRSLCSDSDEIGIAREGEVFVLLYKLQEEVHRFTVSKMDAAKRKTLTHSSLTKIKGIGDSKARLLLSRFGGLAGVRAANVGELAAVKGISRADAENIRKHFDEKGK